MNAIEFVKKFGWKEAQICLLNCAMPQDKWFMHRGSFIECQDFDDLKQIVEAFEFIEKEFESVEIAYYEYMVSGCYSDPFWIKAKQSIELVEKCNA